jgi:hypothetical protein
VIRRIPLALLAVPALGLARLAPAHGVGLGLRLGAAVACLLVPGALVARALGRRSVAAALAWSLGALFLAMTAMFALHRSLWLALAVLGAVAIVALPFAFRAQERSRRNELVVLAVGVAFGVALWHVAALDGDAFFHLARARKLEDLGSLSLRGVSEFRDGGLHPGYAFPLWHGLIALVAKLAGVDPVAVVRHGPTVLAPLSFVLVYEAGVALFASAWMGIAVLCGQVALTGLAAGHGGGYVSLALPTSAGRQLLVPAVLALAFAYVRESSLTGLLTTGVAALGLALVHPTYALFVCVPLGGFVVARVLLARRDLVAAPLALAAAALPTLGVILWLRPIVDQTASHDPSQVEVRRAFAQYPGQLDGGPHRYHLAPELFSRGGAIAVGALLVVPLAALAARKRWAAYVLGGSLAVFALTLVPFVFPRFADAVSISQARRVAGFLPFAVALAGGAAVLAAPLRFVLPPLALATGIALQLKYPGDFGYRFERASPGYATWVAVGGAAVGLVAAALIRRRESVERRGVYAAAAAALFALPVAVHGFARWSPNDTSGAALSRGLVRAVRANVPARSVVLSDPQTGYQLAAYAPVYLVDGPLAHVADTKENRPRARLLDTYRFFTKGADLGIPRRYGATWIVIDRERRDLRLGLPRVYADRRYVLLRLP